MRRERDEELTREAEETDREEEGRIITEVSMR